MSEETIEEAAKIELEYIHEVSRGFDFDLGFKTGMVKGAAWQEKRMYSEEEMREAFKQSRQAKIFEKDMPPVYENFEDWFEQFKKQKL